MWPISTMIFSTIWKNLNTLSPLDMVVIKNEVGKMNAENLAKNAWLVIAREFSKEGKVPIGALYKNKIYFAGKGLSVRMINTKADHTDVVDVPISKLYKLLKNNNIPTFVSIENGNIVVFEVPIRVSEYGKWYQSATRSGYGEYVWENKNIVYPSYLCITKVRVGKYPIAPYNPKETIKVIIEVDIIDTSTAKYHTHKKNVKTITDFKTLEDAVEYAKRWMREHPNGAVDYCENIVGRW